MLGRAVLVLDDRADATVLREVQATVARDVGRGHREHRAGVVRRHGALDQVLDRVGAQERRVTREHDDRALEAAERVAHDAHRMAGAQTLRLLDEGHILACQRRAHLVGAVADDHDHAVDAGVAGGTNRPPDQRRVEDLVNYFGMTGLHTRTLARGEDNRSNGHR